MNVFSWLLGLFSIWWVWVPIVLVLLYLTYQNQRRIKHIDTLEHVLLALEVPRTNDKKQPAAEKLFESLHGILRSKKELAVAGQLQEHLSLEMVAREKRIRFYMRVPEYLQNFVESQVYTQYPSVQMQVLTEDYAERPVEGKVFHSTELALMANQAVPIKVFDEFETDSLVGLAATLSKLDQPDEEYWVQMLIRPVDSRWQQRSLAYARRLKSGQVHFEFASVLSLVMQAVGALWKPPQQSSGGGDPILSENDRQKIEAVEKKTAKPGFQAKIRVAYIGQDETVARMRVQNLLGAFKQFNVHNLNGFKAKTITSGPEGLALYKARFFIDKGFVLNTEELSGLFHLPHNQVEGVSVAWAKGRMAEPPSELPALTGQHAQDNDISAFASTNFRGVNQQFGIYRSDRDRHVYILGQTGVGKSKLLELFALSDLYHGQGYAIIDPHGDFAFNNLYFIPPGRMNDVVYFNPADTAYPIGFNPMELSDPAFKGRVSGELVTVLKYLFGEVWNTRLEYMLRYIVLALLESPGTTVLDITRMLTDQAFRAQIVSRVSDPVVRSFWTDEFENWKQMYASDTISPILNKVGAFTANPIIRNMVGQPQSTFNMRQIMDEGKIFVANLSGSLLGEESAALLGSLLITKIQQAAMSRTDPHSRRPFYLYVDEFQNFATDSFVPILSEARKYGLSLTMANQYIGQMSPLVRDAIFGNVGTMITFRVSPDDANNLINHFSPRFEPKDLTELHNRHFAIAMTVRGEKTAPFSGTTLALPTAQQNYLAEIIANTRAQFAHPREEVEEALKRAAAPIALPKPTPVPQALLQPSGEASPYDTSNAQTLNATYHSEDKNTPQEDDAQSDAASFETTAPIESEQQEKVFRIRHK